MSSMNALTLRTLALPEIAPKQVETNQLMTCLQRVLTEVTGGCRLWAKKMAKCELGQKIGKVQLPLHFTFILAQRRL